MYISSLLVLQTMLFTLFASGSPNVPSNHRLFASVGLKSAIASSIFIPFALSGHIALAVDPAQLRKFARPDQIVLLGGDGDLQNKLKQVQVAQTVLDTADVPFIELPNGISFRQYREGRGERSVRAGSLVTVEMTVRCKSLATNTEPGGVKYYSTAQDTNDKSLTWTIGSGEFLPGLEEGMMGMKKGSIRRIEVPSVQTFAARDMKQLPLPSIANSDGNRRFKNLFKTKADLLFEVLVVKIVDPILSSSSN